MALSLSHSISLSSVSHPIISQFDGHLASLRAFKGVPFSLLSIHKDMSRLEDLYDCVDKMLLLPHTQQSFVKESEEQWVDDVLEGHIRLLDACMRAKDVLSQSRKDVQQLMNRLRRREGEEEEGYDFGKYRAGREITRKMAKKYLDELKFAKNKIVMLDMEKDQETVAVINKLNEAEAETQAVIERLLTYIADRKVRKGVKKWSLVSKMIFNKRLADKEENAIEMNEFELLFVEKTCESIDNLKRQLGKMELDIEDVEGGLERLFRRLIRTRVSLLNALNH